MKIKKIKLRGYSRRAYAMVFVVVFALAGTGYLLYSRAAVGFLVTDTGVAMKANTSPSINSDIIAFNGGLSSRMQFRYYSPAYANIIVNPGNIVDPMMVGSSPSVSGDYITYVSSKGYLQIYNWTTGKIIDTGQTIKAGTNPSISGNIIAFQANTTELYYWNISTGQAVNTRQGMMVGTSPAISGDVIAFQANTTALYYWKISTGQSVNTNQGMMPGTNPSVSGNNIAFQANVSTLYFWNIPGGTSTNTVQYMSSTTSPSINGNTIAFQGSNTNLIYYNIPNVPPPPTVTLTGPASVNSGQGVKLTYKTSNTNSCTINKGTGLINFNGNAFDPTQSIDGAYFDNTISSTSTYTITCTSSTGEVASASWTVTAVGPPSGSITGPTSIVTGQSPTLNISTANVANCSVNGVSVNPNGAYIAPEITEYTNYELKCGGADGTGTALLSYTGVSVADIDYAGQKGNPLDTSSNDPTASASSSTKPKYYYVSPWGHVPEPAIGMSADITTGSPKVGGRTIGSHSLGQIGIHNTKDGNFKTINGVEFGWIVGGVNSDNKPRLFVYNVRNGYNVYDKSHGCYNNGCGFVSTSSKIKPTKSLTPGSVHNYRISYSSASDRWNIYFDNTLIGYYPASLFLKSSGRVFNSGERANPWGEVHDAGGQCVEMGNGILGSNKGSTRIDNYKVQYANGWRAGYFYATTVSNPKFYNAGNKSDFGLNFGGPGRSC